tara:strand:+ start:72126 stop:75899 length:3774 start_codon:yes stop_codon:yes gene_type:complete
MKQKLLFLLITILFTVNNFSQSSFISQVKDCATGCSDLTIHFDSPSPTINYSVVSIPNNPPASFSGLENQLFSNIDDIWSDEVILPFTFSFYGESYNSLIVGANGVISFDVSNAGRINDWLLDAPIPNNTNTTFSQANIFWAGHDVDPSAGDGTHEIGYETFGTAPNRMFVASFFNVSQFDCADLKTTQMVVLYETTNIIEVHILDKSVCQTWNSGNAVLGVQNPEGTEAVVPPGRNTGAWEASNESWRFIPAGNGFMNEYAWYNEAGTLISTNTIINVCPTVNETYTAEVNYYAPNLEAYQIATETVTVYVSVTGETLEDLVSCNEIETDVDFDLSIQTEVLTGGSTCSIVSYFTSLVDADNDTNAITNPEYYSNITNPETIYVRVQNSDPGTFETTMFNLVVDVIPEIGFAELFECAIDGNNAIFNLSNMDDSVTNGNTNYSVSYYTTYDDAEYAENMLPQFYLNEISDYQVIYARVVNENNTCYRINECYLNVLNGANFQNVSLVQCDDETNDGFAEFNIETVLPEILNGQNAELTFYETEADANNMDNPIGNIQNYTNTSNPQIIFVRGENLLSDCVGISTIELFVEEAIALTAPSPLTICDLDGTADGFAHFNLSEKDSEILGGLTPNNYAISYFETLTDAESNMNALNATNYTNVIAGVQTVFVRVDNITAGCFATTTLELVVDLDCPVGCQETFTFCYDSYDTTEYVHTSDNGLPLTAVFTAGQVENDWDELIVLDSDGTTLYEGYGNSGDVTGLTFTSTGDSITIKVLSDASVSCASGARNPISYYLYCLDFENNIVVNAFLDENGDSIFDDSELKFNEGLFSYEMNNDGVINYVNSSYGSFIIPNTQVGDTYDVSFVMYENYSECLSQTITLIENVSPIEGETVAVNFPLTPLGDCTDIAVGLFSFTPPRPGQIATNYLVVGNLGNIPVSGSVEFTHDALVAFNNISGLNPENTITNTSTGFILNFNNLMPGMEEEILVQLDVPTNLNIGDFITNSALYGETDLDVSNNSSTLTQAVVNSYDPNDKTESHGPEIKLDDFSNEDYLYYTINFQNLGTAEALEIRVEDILDSQLDASSFKMLNASHDYTVTRIDNELTWEFDDINLPSESMDEPNSHGYVYFRIKPLPGYSEGDVIPNTADIYFDFNPAITTNTFETEFVANLSVEEFASVGYSMYPNPAKTVVNFEFNKSIGTHVNIQVYDIHGKLVSKSNHSVVDNKISCNISNLPQGLYFMELINNTFNTIEKLIVN